MISQRTQLIFGIIGRSGSGKTHLISRLLPAFCNLGLRVSTIKHTHHGVDMDKPGKDTFAHRQNGATEVMLATPERWVLQHECNNTLPTISDLLQRMEPVDLVLVEGFHATIPTCLEVWRPTIGKTPLFPQTPGIVAVASDNSIISNVPDNLTILDMNDTMAIAAYIRTHAYAFKLSN
ncbi:molybdopterin-guanine dinucleotide biosynthesis protein B [Acetobacter ascendens]|uniref:Molybdopterin-guanine dinucleotide biosynthesis adapter protein n=1 Tax=Acetobacter ascendens TaxID=481146 RepID=A0A1Y0V0W6_9PROT|nr:molybdopterin-guanine dinucleotide biosynthesis protein B [Acetobacter ascendens]ARW11434.1 Molybdopterin-guanine dinucleotide biosynthesis adapter protein [Acetobacter ascendens]RCL05086.1 molybdopterin-guanine dinucleotide biosynthesis protein B [Acetobacter pasteurianus]GCD75170.1 molybdopterin-guanine dinucleotide biosynthesis protein B [Acetobacter pasteurianus NBRC 3299]